MSQMTYGGIERMSRFQCDIRPMSSFSPVTILRPMAQRATTGLERRDRPFLAASMTGVGVLAVHHEEEARRAVRSVVNAAPGFDVVGEAATAEEALELAVALRPSLALVGVGMPGIDGFETSRRLGTALPTTTVVLLFTSVEPSEDNMVGSQAVAAVSERALTPTSLRDIWDEHRTV